ncbi:MAG: hypothetical protein MUC79_01790 [Thiobacillaceae bacterium]|jgi:HemY protein|nr:hypothetical protein [Thiobacillaceae bacterium]
MMRAAFWLLLLAGLAIAIAVLSRLEAGYVLLVYPPWRVEMSVAMALGVLIAAFVALYVFLRLLNTTLRLPADVRSWRSRRRRDKAGDELTRAVAALISGQPAHARKLAEKAHGREPSALAALVAARAAAELGDHPGATRLIQDAGSETGELVAARQAIERLLAERAAPPETEPASVSQ